MPRPDWINADHERASETLTRIAQELTPTADAVCQRETDRDLQGIWYIPVLLVAAVKNEGLVCSTCQFQSRNSVESVAELLTMTADHLMGGSDKNRYGEEERLQ
jgi:hypothetical protein